MKPLDIMTALWYLPSDILSELQKAYDNYLAAPQDTLDAFDKNMASFLADSPERGFDIINGYAVIYITGLLTPELGIFSFLFGGTSTEAVQQAVNEAADDSDIKEILLMIDTPGGVVYNTQETAETVFNARSKKPITAFVKGKMLSAGTYIGAAAHKVYMSGDLVDVGHIGVRTQHVDISELNNKIGVKVTDLSVGAFKTLGSPNKPLSAEDKEQYMASLQYSYEIFTRDVAKYRGLDQQKIIEMGARVFQGKQAIDVGLADGITAFDDLINKSAGSSPAGSQNRRTLQGGNMDLTTLKAEHLDTYNAALKLGEDAGIAKGKALAEDGLDVKLKAAKDEGITLGRTEGATTEAARIADVRSHSVSGCEDIIEKMVADGKSTGPDAAVKVLAFQKAMTEAAGEAFQFDGEDIAATAAGGDEGGEEKDFMALVADYKTENKCSQGEAIKAVALAQPDTHAKYLVKLKNPDQK